MRRNLTVFLLSFSHLIHDIYTSFLAPVLPLLIQKLGIGMTEASLLDVARRAPALLNIYLGALISRKDLRLFTVISPITTALFMSLIGVAPNYTVLIILLFLAGLSAQVFHIATPSIVKRVTPKMGFGMSAFMVGGELARTVAPLIATAVVGMWGVEGLYRTLFLAVLASAFLWQQLSKLEVDFQLEERKSLNLGALLKFRNFFLPIAGFMFFQSFSKMFLTFYLPVYLIHTGKTLSEANLSLSFFQFFAIIGTFLSGNVADRIGNRQTLSISTALALISMPIFLFSNLLYPSLILLGLSLFSTGPVMLSIIHNQKNSTALNGVYMMISFLIPATVTFLIGSISDLIGLKNTAVLSFSFLLFALFVSFKVKETV